ncbi:hypothetical protein [Sinorhizobium mexicanum]|uniref:Glycosyltransferase RgtA/B/C/D-like domain-containing protein n=1 Tax=Sinorhizobium mexicanum TaxID=375549 RepID=A0A859QRG5_9HYPH|nr:hypothetical protein [Sinorhizobium mexicanum]QLL65975.1 hypothetical protein FKV68_32435 [Sinorhizobium mexicanum]
MTNVEEISVSKIVGQSVRPRALLFSAGMVVLSGLLLFCLLLRVMNYEVRKDEQLYVPPIRLLDQYQLYTDFFYNHPPGSAWLFYGIGKIVGSDHLMLAGRVSIFLTWILLLAVIGWITYALTRSALVAWCAAVLTVTNELFLSQTGMTATNNLLPLPFSLLGVGLFVLAVKDRRALPLVVGAAGFCLSIAASFKISAVAFIPPVAIAAFFLPRGYQFRQRLLRVVLPLALGGLLGGLPILVPLVSDPQMFLAHVLGYHTGPHLQYWQDPAVESEGASVSWAAKLLLAQSVWLSATVAVAISAVLTLFLAWFLSPAGNERLLVAPLLVVAGAFVCSVALSLIPTPGFPQYFGPPLICLPLTLALLYAGLGHETRRYMQPGLIAATIVVLAVAAPRLAQYLPTVSHPERWTVLRVHEAGETVAERLAAAGVSGKVATLSPIYPLEGGLPVYQELATGPFAYRIADIADPKLAAFYKMTSPTTIGALFDADPPAALLLGFDEVLERPMLAYAQRNGYVVSADLGIKDRYGAPVLYVRPQAD